MIPALVGVADTTWWGALPAVAVATVLLFLPGLGATLLLGLRGTTALALAPPISVTTIALGGVLAAYAHMSWSAGVLAGLVALLWVVAAVLGLLLRRWFPVVRSPGLWPALLGTGLALAVVAAVLAAASGGPDAIPQHPDTVFHLSAIRWMDESANISSLRAAGYASPTGGGFYPAAFHGVATTVLMLSGCTVTTSASVTALVAAGLVWPIGTIALARTVLGPSASVSIAAGLASVAFSAFPFWFLGYGVLWPNLLGQALLPALLVAAWALCWGPDRLRQALVLAVGLPGLALAHPNALIALAALGALLAVPALVTAGRRASRTWQRVLAWVTLVGFAAAAAGGWTLATQRATAMRASNPVGYEMPVPDAALDVLLFAPRQASYLWAAGLLVLVGLVLTVLRRGRGLWVVAAWVLCTALYIGVVLVDNDVTRWFTWPWYNNSPRFAALLVVPSSVLAAAGLAAAIDWLSGRRLVTRGPLDATAGGERPGGRATRRPRLRPTAATAAVVAAYLVASLGGGFVPHLRFLEPYFAQTTAANWVRTGELTALRELGGLVPPDAVVAANPYNGGSYLYLLTGRHLLFPSEKAWGPEDLEVLGRRLRDAGKSKAVCAAARREHVTYALTGGDPTSASLNRMGRYRGIDSVGGSDAFEFVAEAAPYRLYRLTGCKR